ncbi:MAG: hypothetical protein CVU39_17335 [Chloroflexi bacterium HGW-Chloroflexi-10]|nr:MAG: hypothetical protein CVU39_17335 [Chloroflexi bacterium HGW-Chloroflexi-10]
MQISNNLDQLVIGRRLILHAQRSEDQRKGKRIEEKSAKDEMDEDRALISGNVPVEGVTTQSPQQKTENVDIKLSDLFARLKEFENQQPGNAAQQVQVNFEQVIEREASFRYTVLEKVDGLVRRSQTLAETDRYSFEFSDGTTFKITDKWSNRSTTIWGDPHVDVDDEEGNLDGDFQDLKGSDSHTTLMLLDGTQVSFTAKDNGIIEAVDIYKGSQHLNGIGEASTKWNMQNGLFASQVENGAGNSSAVPKGDTVYAGGDGNDWFTSSGQLLWGKTTSPIVNTRPYATMQLEYRERITQQISVQVNKQV